MLGIFAITFPIFAAVALGYALVRFGVFRSEDMRTFGGFVMNIAMPPLIFNAVSGGPVGEVFDLPYILAYTLGALVTMAIAFGYFSAVTGPLRRGVAVMGAACPNSGFIGFPLMLILFPDLAGQILAMNMLVENVILVPVALTAVELGRGREGGASVRLDKVLLGVLKRPMVIALLLGLAVTLIGLEVPAPVTRLTSMFAASAAALALVVIGGSLAGLPTRGNRALAAQISLTKLVLHPAVTLAVIAVLGGLGIVLTGDLRAAALISAAIPMFSIYVVLVQDTGHGGLASLSILIATLASFVTLNLLLYVLT